MAGTEYGKHMGALKRGDKQWDVYLEGQPDGTLGAVRGRLHFVSGQEHKMTGWIFLERHEKEIPHFNRRFAHFCVSNRQLRDFLCKTCTVCLTPL